jgi:outer membrane lipoprotein carrier protein
MKIKGTYLFVITIFSLCFAGDEDAGKILTRVRKEYDALNNFCAEYTQTFTWKLAGESQSIDGTICVKDKEKFKIETPNQSIITDGKTVWTVNTVTKQVMIDQASENKEDNPFLKEFMDRFTRDYRVQTSDQSDETNFVLILTALTQEQFVREIDLWVNKKTFQLARIKQIDVNSNLTLYEVKKIDTAISLKNSDFEYVVPDGYESIDLR